MGRRRRLSDEIFPGLREEREAMTTRLRLLEARKRYAAMLQEERDMVARASKIARPCKTFAPNMVRAAVRIIRRDQLRMVRK